MNTLLAILLTSTLYLAFKWFDRKGIDTFQGIVFNYITCVITGWFFAGLPTQFTIPSDVWMFPLLLGTLFMSTFYLIGTTARTVSVTASTISSKMSLIIPVLVNLFVWNRGVEAFTLWHYAGMALTFPAVILATYTPASVARAHSTMPSWKKYGLVLFVFLFTGLIDTLVNHVSSLHTDATFQRTFPLLCFAVAATVGGSLLLIQCIKKQTSISAKNVFGGIVLGIPNYFSIYFLMKAIEDFNGQGAVLFPLINVGVILFCAIMAWVLFGERLLKIHYVGIMLAIVAMWLMTR